MDDLSVTGILFGLVVVVLLFIFGNPITIVNAGEIGIKQTLGVVSDQSYTEGVHFVTPFISKIHKMNVKTQKTNPATTVFSKDIQQARIEYVVNYNLQPENAYRMYKEVGRDYKNVVLMPVVEGTIKNVIGSWNAQDLIANRTKATSDILFELQTQLKDNYINVTDFQITDIDYSDTFEKAIEEKVTAEQEALKAKNKTVQVEEEAKQKVISAQAEAKSIKIKAEALKQNRDLVSLTIAEKWDGRMPTHVLGNSIPLLDLK